jgi:hypothetical protein
VTIKRFVKKPITIEALQFNGCNQENIRDWVGHKVSAHHRNTGKLYINTLEGTLVVNIGDYVVQGIAGEFYPVREDIFNQSYEEIKDDSVCMGRSE